ncbi:hypothetical protein, partial [Delftia tsuruhatensis]|uniref:hypothetical protein n=1 Tax=Delftia tsuruhatensis TaxID=180282 RepID=UPI00289D92F4
PHQNDKPQNCKVLRLFRFRRPHRPAQARTEAVAMVQALGNGYFLIFSWFSVGVQKARYNSKLGGCSSAG